MLDVQQAVPLAAVSSLPLLRISHVTPCPKYGVQQQSAQNFITSAQPPHGPELRRERELLLDERL